MPEERLQKIIAAAGIASRRHAEELITQGRVSVNDEVIRELGSKADPQRDSIRVDGRLLRGPERPVYLLLHKPKGYVTTVTDPEGRPTVMKLVRHLGGERVYPVGRLDYLSEGLLLLTNDGSLAQKLMHASTHLPKVYEVKVSGKPAEEEIERLRRGILLPARSMPLRLPDGSEGRPGQVRRQQAVRTQPAKIRLLREAANPWYEVTLVEGRNRQIRRMFEQIGHHVEKIKRVKYGPLELDVEPGQARPLREAEVRALKAAARGEVWPGPAARARGSKTRATRSGRNQRR
ncbi:MAG TPA: pseudouridine synthase [Terriglobales bacterium]|nr:pseudouridine synthase [Terriglobales bacterium]